MQGVTFSTPKEISDAWKSNMALTDGLLEAVASASGSSSETEGVLKALDETAKKMEQIYAAAIKSAEYEDNCCGFSYRSFLGLMGKGIDAGIQVVTTIFLAKAFGTEEEEQNLYATVGLVAISLIASKFKQRVEKRNIKLAEDLGLLEDILPNYSHITHVRSQVKFYGTATSPQSPKSEVNPFRAGFQRSQAIAGIVKKSICGLIVDRKALRERYFTKAFGCYAHLHNENISELVKLFKTLKETMTREEEIIKGIREVNAAGEVIIIVRQLGLQLVEMRKIFADVSEIIIYHNELENSRAKCLTQSVRLSVQLMIELAALVSVILDAVIGDSNSNLKSTKLAALSLYVINIVLSWLNTGIARIHEKNAEIFQQIKRLNGQKVYMEHIDGMVKRGGGVKKRGNGAPVFRMDRAPVLAAQGSPLQIRIQELYVQAVNPSPSGKNTRRLQACDLYIRDEPFSHCPDDLETVSEDAGESDGQGVLEMKGEDLGDMDSELRADGAIEVKIDELALGLGTPHSKLEKSTA